MEIQSSNPRVLSPRIFQICHKVAPNTYPSRLCTHGKLIKKKEDIEGKKSMVIITQSIGGPLSDQLHLARRREKSKPHVFEMDKKVVKWI